VTLGQQKVSKLRQESFQDPRGPELIGSGTVLKGLVDLSGCTSNSESGAMNRCLLAYRIDTE
jgi:hypothetical protein